MIAARLRILALIDLVQDMDVLLPVLLRLRQMPEICLRAVVSRWLASRAPRIPALLRAAGIDFRYVDRSRILLGLSPSLRGVDALLTASESSASPHRWGHALTVRARAQGCATFTLQHGLDNLRVFGGSDPAGPRVASDVFFCWPSRSRLPTDIDPAFSRKLVCVGRPLEPASPSSPSFDLGVFENLHAKAYSDEQRDLVTAQVLGLVAARRDLKILIRAHPAGGWLDRAQHRLAAFPNVVYTPSALARREVDSGRDAVGRVARVITTPSTIALDAAAAGRPVAIALGGDPLYDPLPALVSQQDWLDFADSPAAPSLAGAEFLDRHCRPGDAAGLVVEHMISRRAKAHALLTI